MLLSMGCGSHLSALDLLASICGSDVAESRCHWNAFRMKHLTQSQHGGLHLTDQIVTACTTWNWEVAPSNSCRLLIGMIAPVTVRSQ